MGVHVRGAHGLTVDSSGVAGRIEALLIFRRAPRAAVVLAHPHPQHGGTMRSRVIHEAAHGFTRAGAATLRFNFRGVGLSAGGFDQGLGEKADFLKAVDEAASRFPGLPVWAAGYSFGAWVAASAFAVDKRVELSS